jgi:hypothetical protein
VSILWIGASVWSLLLVLGDAGGVDLVLPIGATAGATAALFIAGLNRLVVRSGVREMDPTVRDRGVAGGSQRAPGDRRLDRRDPIEHALPVHRSYTPTFQAWHD